MCQCLSDGIGYQENLPCWASAIALVVRFLRHHYQSILDVVDKREYLVEDESWDLFGISGDWKDGSTSMLNTTPNTTA